MRLKNVELHRYMRYLILFLCILTSFKIHAQAGPPSWPQEVPFKNGKIIIYQPQPEKLEGNQLSGRVAFSIEQKNKSPVFGALWFTSRIDTESESGITSVRALKVTKTAWPESDNDTQEDLKRSLESAVPTAGFQISMDRLSASLQTAELVKKSLEDLNTEPPKIIFNTRLAVLLPYDGDPLFKDIDDSNYERVLNTPMAVVRNKKTKILYLSSASLFYKSISPMGPWTQIDTPPEDLVKLVPAPDTVQKFKGEAPEIITTTEPAEIVSTDGEPQWHSLVSGNLLYVSNTETAWLRDISTGNMYLLLSGRWFSAKTQNGPWALVRPDKLPPGFKNIPPASDIGGARVSISGTTEANRAMTDAAIPQTAAIDRNAKKPDVKYDGSPKFVPISGTEVSYATNTGAQVLLIDSQYYVADNGVWFVGKSATGPWVVADNIPDDKIQAIPPTSPVYNTVYIRVFDSTPQVVYVGYYPGYRWSFTYYGVPVYGTGWYYPPYYGAYYYPRPPTWGLHVGYNPWIGWSYGASWSTGFYAMGITYGAAWGGAYYGGACCGGGWYGAGYQHNTTVINTGNINIGNTVSIGNRNISGNSIQNNNQSINHNGNNLYSQRQNNSNTSRSANSESVSAGRSNNVYADKHGNIAKRDGDNWQTRNNGEWQTANRPSSTPSRNDSNQLPHSFQNFDFSGLDRSHSSRRDGASREKTRGNWGGRGSRH